MPRLLARLLSIGCFSTLIATMAAIDESFRGLLGSMLQIQASSALTASTASFHHLTRSVAELVPVPLAGQGPLIFFAVSGGVLFLVMFRT
jgi:hypothetical protein